MTANAKSSIRPLIIRPSQAACPRPASHLAIFRLPPGISKFVIVSGVRELEGRPQQTRADELRSSGGLGRHRIALQRKGGKRARRYDNRGGRASLPLVLQTVCPKMLWSLPVMMLLTIEGIKLLMTGYNGTSTLPSPRADSWPVCTLTRMPWPRSQPSAVMADM